MTVAAPHSSVPEGNFEKGTKEKEKREAVAAAGLREQRPGCACLGRGLRAAGHGELRAPGELRLRSPCPQRPAEEERQRASSERGARCCGQKSYSSLPLGDGDWCPKAPGGGWALLSRRGGTLRTDARQVPPPRSLSAAGRCGPGTPLPQSELALASPSRTARRVIPFGRSCPS